VTVCRFALPRHRILPQWLRVQIIRFGSPRSPDNRVELASQIQEGSVHGICDAVQVLGYISFSPIRDYLFVDAVAVLPRLHRQSLGTQLLAFAEKEACACACEV
jgi:ribosomal protein S18 acetylase RimI-like enzyme